MNIKYLFFLLTLQSKIRNVPEYKLTKMHKTLILIAICGLMLSCNNGIKVQSYKNDATHERVTVAQPTGTHVKNVILMIGDGMGLPQVSCGWTANHGQLNLDNFQYTGISRTYCASQLITDSGAGGSALACGQKTTCHYIAKDPEGNDMLSLIDYAHLAGMKAGVSVVCALDDATPVSFCCHDTSRYSTDALIADYLETKADLVVGGGRNYFMKRDDGRNIADELAANGWNVATDETAFFAVDSLPLFGILADGDYPLPSVRGDLFTRQTMKAIEMLDNDQGFFLMVEGSLIDGWCHENVIENMVAEMLDFDKTIGAVLEWAAADGETLVVVTADHESGALTLLDGDYHEGLVEVHFANDGHSNIQVPLYAFGPQAWNFTGTKENCEWGQLIRSFISTND